MTIHLQGDHNAANLVDQKELQDLAGNMWPSDLLEIIKAHKKDPLTENEREAIVVANAVLDDQTNAVLDDDESTVDLGDFCCYQLPVLLGAIKRLAKS